MESDQFKPHDINVTEVQTIGTGGTITTAKRLTFWVGTHGPFTKTYAPGAYTAAQAKLDIQKEIDDLQSLHSWAG